MNAKHKSLDELLSEDERPNYFGPLPKLFMAIAFIWSVFQLWIASPLPYAWGIGVFVDLPVRGIHLAFALALCFLLFPSSRERQHGGTPVCSILLSVIAAGCAAYVWLNYSGIVSRNGILLDLNLFGIDIPFEALLSGCGVLLLLEAARRGVGLPLVIVCLVFILYALFGQAMPEVIAHKGVSLERLVGYFWLTGESVFGIPIDVSVSYVFLFVLFGAVMDTAGAGRFFLDLSFALVGKYRGGPAKAAILASGMTGMISGSSIANTVTTGAFTIPVMKKTGFPAEKAGAIEVAASINGQIMPPIMGASAFIIAEFIGISYYDVIVHGAIPALISYLALFYISHLEASKLGLKGMPKPDLPRIRKTLAGGFHFLIPMAILVYLLLVKRWSPGSAVFYSILLMMLIIVIQEIRKILNKGGSIKEGLKIGCHVNFLALVAGAKSMAAVTAAVGAAGIIVGVVSSTGLNNAMLGIVEQLSQGNIYLLLILVAFVSIILGMGLPTTANYIVVASLMAGVLVELGRAAGLELPLIAVHLFVFYFGIMADATPPVCLASFAAAAISGGDPMKTGAQSFLYSIRTAILPFVFIFNPTLLLVGVDSIWEIVLTFIVSLLAIIAFSSLTMRWFMTRLNFIEIILLIFATFAFFRPDFVLDKITPAYETMQFAELKANNEMQNIDGKIRFHVTRETEYGDRYKLFVINPEKSVEEVDILKNVGLTLDKEDDGRLIVTNLDFNGPAEQAGMDFGDYVTAVDVEQMGRPRKEIIYPFALLAFLLALGSQYFRVRKQK